MAWRIHDYKQAAVEPADTAHTGNVKITEQKAVSYNKHNLNPYTKIDKKASAFFLDFFTELYKEHYIVHSVRAYAVKKEGQVSPTYFIEIRKTLRYDTVEELPFVVGMQFAVQKKPTKLAESIYRDRVNELQQYIKTLQTEYNELSVSYDKQKNFLPKSISVTTYKQAGNAAELLKPQTYEELIESGKKFINTAVAKHKYHINFDGEAAVDYADRYTSNPHNADSNPDVWNEDCRNYESDCANYVSQCLAAGGIKTTPSWQPDSLLWIRSGSRPNQNKGVSDYMLDKNLFFKTDYAGIGGGGFICLIQEPHIMLVASNDSITILYNGHTNDRKHFCFPHIDTSHALYATPNK